MTCSGVTSLSLRFLCKVGYWCLPWLPQSRCDGHPRDEGSEKHWEIMEVSERYEVLGKSQDWKNCLWVRTLKPILFICFQRFRVKRDPQIPWCTVTGVSEVLDMNYNRLEDDRMVLYYHLKRPLIDYKDNYCWYMYGGHDFRWWVLIFILFLRYLLFIFTLNNSSRHSCFFLSPCLTCWGASHTVTKAGRGEQTLLQGTLHSLSWIGWLVNIKGLIFFPCSYK